jgi:apolipoprotein N-acyltransferase
LAKKKTRRPSNARGWEPEIKTPEKSDLWQHLGLAALSAILVWLAFPPVDLGFLAWVALAPLLIAVARMSMKRTLWVSAVMGYVLCIALFAWIRHTTWVAWPFLSLYCAFFWFAAAWMLKWLNARKLPFIITAPLVFTIVEFTRAYALTGFPFMLLAHTQYRVLPLVQIVDITGVFGITFLIGLVNGVIADIVLAKDRKVITVRRAPIAVGILLATLIYGLAIMPGDLQEDAHTPTRRIVLVQGNVPTSLKHSPSPEDAIGYVQDHIRLSLSNADDGVDLIIWPETMVPGYVNWLFEDGKAIVPPAITEVPKAQRWRAFNDRITIAAIEKTTRETKIPLLLGARTVTKEPDAKHFNSAYFVSPDCELLGRYDKIHRVIFGEYVPLVNIFPFLRVFRPPQMGADLSPGVERTLFPLQANEEKSVPQHRFGVTICYEDSVASLFRKFVKDGADFMVNMTNDGWFLDSAELDAHLALCVFRAIENKIPIARATNTGISAFIDPAGRILKVLEKDGKVKEVQGVLAMNLPIPPRTSLTIYTRFGDVFAWACVVGLVFLTGVARAKQKLAAQTM